MKRKEVAVTTPIKGELYMGVEIECLLLGRSIEVELGRIAEVYGGKGSIIYGKWDGTVDDNIRSDMPPVVPVELVTQPMTLECYLNRTWKPIFDRYHKPQEYITSTLGGHIHLSKSAFTPTQMYKLMRFIRTNIEYIRYIGEQEFKYNSYRKTSSKSGNACFQVKNKLNNMDRYEIVNVTDFGTIELRFFGSPYSPSCLKKNVEWCHALWSFVKTSPLDFTAKEFNTWVLQRVKEYSFIREYLLPVADMEWTSNEEFVVNTPRVPNSRCNHTCYSCNYHIEDEDDIRLVGDTVYCIDCVSYCETCDEATENDDITTVYTGRGERFVCSYCREHDYYYCDGCQDHFDSGSILIGDNFNMCHRCAERLDLSYCDSCENITGSCRETTDGTHECLDCTPYGGGVGEEVDEEDE